MTTPCITLPELPVDILTRHLPDQLAPEIIVTTAQSMAPECDTRCGAEAVYSPTDVFNWKGAVSVPALSISLFGHFDAHEDGRSIAGLDRTKVQELLSYLLLFRDRPHPRESLAGVLWSENPSQSRKYLRQALWRLQCVLNAQVDSKVNEVLLIDTDLVQINQQSDIWLDVATFEQVCFVAQGVSGEDLADDAASLIEDAMPLYRGDLLEGWYQDWCLRERERLHYLFLANLYKLMAYCETRNRYEAGVDYGELILRHDRAHELTHQRLMRLYYLTGDRTQALRQYDRCAQALEEELDVQPARYTRDLYQQIRADRLGMAGQFPPWVNHREQTALSDLSNQIRQLQSTLADVQERLQSI